MRRAQARQSYISRYVVILLRVYWRKVMRARRTASVDWWITPGTAGMRPRDLFTTSRDYRESVGSSTAGECREWRDQKDFLATIHKKSAKCVSDYAQCRVPLLRSPIYGLKRGLSIEYNEAIKNGFT
ncbi:hypothetical protein EVAR_66750_1 [Eumeta japonica]|uniref:Uncharacterized protein n=1 Tax=Eumeta variegata TaxID=151549 RepID=A0A4C1Z8G2_EUMVA|nr:hypothetical protein EVAR_66750_1 [Eumeta japonica]